MVALRKESVDRNNDNGQPAICQEVALRKESVDRNRAMSGSPKEDIESRSARRAWIEMPS